MDFDNCTLAFLLCLLRLFVALFGPDNDLSLELARKLAAIIYFLAAKKSLLDHAAKRLTYVRRQLVTVMNAIRFNAELLIGIPDRNVRVETNGNRPFALIQTNQPCQSPTRGQPDQVSLLHREGLASDAAGREDRASEVPLDAAYLRRLAAQRGR